MIGCIFQNQDTVISGNVQKWYGYVNKSAIRDFLAKLSYPLYFLDFETMQPVIPEFIGTTPYQQITFQYSLHYFEEEGGELYHKEFLAESGMDPRRALGGSFSIKSVLPAIYPDDPELDYHNLDGVHNGSEAMSIFPMLKDMEPNEREVTRKNLLKYCELDTYAMVKVWEELVKVSEEE